jgi:MarR family transcriptional regulator, 2-MHQ and catechol-resistance regulon repressor
MTTIEEAIKARSFKNSKHKALVNIFYTSNFLLNQLEVIFDENKISRQQYNVLRILRGVYPNSSNCGNLKNVMLERNPDITRLCNRLIEKKYISRNQNPNNKRNMQLTITLEGLNLLEKIEPYVNEHFNNLKLTLAEAEQLSYLLDKLRG